MGNVKGTALAGRLSYARKRGGEEAVQAVIAELTDPQAREALADGKPLKNLWYPFSALVDITTSIDRMYGRGDLSMAAEIGGEVAEQDLSTVYKIFFRFANPHYIIDRASAVWRQYYTSGEVLVTNKADNAVTIELHDFDTPARAHCLSILGWMVKTLQMTGCKDVVGAHPKCRVLGDAVCSFDGSWKL